MLNKLATKASSKILCNNTKRSYAVVAQTPRAYDTSKEDFKAASPLQSLWNNGAYEDRLISLLTAIRPYKITPDFVAAANEALNKQYKAFDLIPKDKKNLDFARTMDGVETIELDEHTLTSFYGEDYKEILDEFFELKPVLSQRAMDRYLQLNSEQYLSIKKERAEKILAWCQETAKKL